MANKLQGILRPRGTGGRKRQSLQHSQDDEESDEQDQGNETRIPKMLGSHQGSLSARYNAHVYQR